MSAPAEPWAQVLLTNGNERVLVLLTAVTDKAWFGVPSRHTDNRVVFPKDTWALCGDDE